MSSNKSEEPSRSAGVLLHPTSLPGRYGIGDLGPEAFAWVRALARTGVTWWQILPLGPPGAGDSPYQCFSAFAGNPALISPDALAEDGLVDSADLQVATLPEGPVDYERVGQTKSALLKRAWERFRDDSVPSLRDDFEKFCKARAHWLDDFALFMAIKEEYPTISWTEWPTPLVKRDLATLLQVRQERRDAVGRHQFTQFLFHRQWEALHTFTHDQGMGLIGDLPIFVSPDSADVWSRPDLFLLDEHRHPRVIAGVPPDYFSKTGQRWGNPLYDWDAMCRTGYSWWIERLRSTLQQVDLVRIDHFRGFEAYWEVPASSPTAEVGRWVKGPGADLFRALRDALGRLPVIAEDLGVITPEVEELRTQFGLPGMRVLQFAFGGAVEERLLPHSYDNNTVVYTGTHDNDTTLGWYRQLTREELTFLRRYVPHVDEDVSWALIRLAWASVANLAVTPLQDVLGLGTEGRMNQPGTVGTNWRWRFSSADLTEVHLDRLADLTDVYRRRPRGSAAETST